jgi:hypothetical protein
MTGEVVMTGVLVMASIFVMAGVFVMAGLDPAIPAKPVWNALAAHCP